MKNLTLLAFNTLVPGSEIPYEYELRVVEDHLELWRFMGIYGDRANYHWRRRERRKMRCQGKKFPRKGGTFKKPPYRYIWKKAKARWEEDGEPARWVCRFDAFAIVESGTFKDTT